MTETPAIDDIESTSRPARAPVEGWFIPPKQGALILGLQLLLLVFRLGQVPLLGPDEPRYARVAIEMARANEFVRPTLAGEAWLEKPPLYYWLAGLGYRLIGETEIAARWPAILAALLMTGFTGLVASRLFGASVGRVAMLILATSPLVFAYGRAATMDMLLAAFVTGASGLFILSILGIAGPSSVPAAWALMAFAVLAKGPIGALIPLGIAVATAVALRRFALTRLVSPLGIGIAALIAGPWFIGIYLDQGFHFVEVFLLNHNLERFTSTIHNHPGPFYYYVPVLLLGVFPWTGIALVLAATFGTFDPRNKWVLAIWLLVPLLLFSAAGSKLPGYILPCLPPLTIGLAAAARFLQADERRGTVRAAGLFGLVIAAATLAFCVRATRQGEPWGRVALMPTIWILATAFLTSQAFQTARKDCVRILFTSAAGLLLLLTLVAPPVLEAMESGRRLFVPVQGREVLVVGAWRTAWMSGYFYNDGRVKEVSMGDAQRLIQTSPQLLLMGASEWQTIQSSPQFQSLKLAQGPRGTVLARISARLIP